MQTAELFVGNVLADRRASKLRASRVPNCGTSCQRSDFLFSRLPLPGELAAKRSEG